METEINDILDNGYVTEIICGIAGYSISELTKTIRKRQPNEKPLILCDFYPVEFNYETKKIVFNIGKFNEAIENLLKKKNIVATEQLAYIVHKNNYEKTLTNSILEKYKKLIKTRFINTNAVSLRFDALLDDYKTTIDINYIHHQFLPQEYILHNMLNPFASVIYAQGTKEVTKREVGDPATNFAMELLTRYIKGGYKLNEFAGYRVKGMRGSTEIIEDGILGLIGFLCINTNLDRLKTILNNDELREKIIKEAFDTKSSINENIKSHN